MSDTQNTSPDPAPLPTPGDPTGTPTPAPELDDDGPDAGELVDAVATAVAAKVNAPFVGGNDDQADGLVVTQPVQATTQLAAPVKRYAVYNDTLQQYVGPVVTEKPTVKAARELVPEGHQVTVREV